MAKPKRKRFEGLIHFKDSLRQTVVCLQASLAKRFATSVQSPLIENLDETAEDAYYLLLSSDQDVGQVSDEAEINQHHVLTRLCQCFDDKTRDAIAWHQQDLAKVSAWLDPADQIGSSYLYLILLQICNQSQNLDLKLCRTWGSFAETHDFQSMQSVSQWIEGWRQAYRVNDERTKVFSKSLKQAGPLFESIDQLQLSSDGTFISLTIEGRIDSNLKASTQQIIDACKDLSGHTVVLNLHEVDQISIVLPIRITQGSRPYGLRSFIVIRDLDANGAKSQQTKQAS